MNIESITRIVCNTIDRDSGINLINGNDNFVKRVITENGGNVNIEIEFGYPAMRRFEEIREHIVGEVSRIPGVVSVNVRVNQKIAARAVRRGIKLLPGVKNIVVVASGKGGVGKSTTAVNLALALSYEGASVGILDADIYGPSLPTLLGICDKPQTKDGKMMQPLVAHGLQANSIGFLIETDNPLVWRGPLVAQALWQLVSQTHWQDLDYLIIDMPPGTGDVQLTLSQKVPVTGAVIVTTPQDLALLDARKGLKMFQKVDVPILGLIENMSVHICSNCGYKEAIFGTSGGERICQDLGIDLLGKLPLEMSIRMHADAGLPSVIAEPDGRVAEVYRAIARKMTAKLMGIAKDMTSKFPPIVVKKKYDNE
ncbi:iron-sulfur cluster carrier protein ApbC [Candidatus Pandoraea novymonadis]|uniref:Iron-sulfur cluster carrier protein n=1 Tax=Candidatus Pandoraea novymonadis TaxID=1808959 RepID=A0ABX5FGA5_9BURK|nr:iron-sulfur cluster carrier protein ApbC [Candidatus Pandoraea novymonadis]PSB92152.1 Iron-sulfur cluster carrier protein [Candidatus Pandoraea novymonadis]